MENWRSLLHVSELSGVGNCMVNAKFSLLVQFVATWQTCNSYHRHVSVPSTLVLLLKVLSDEWMSLIQKAWLYSSLDSC